jgi:hypothetical protein
MHRGRWVDVDIEVRIRMAHRNPGISVPKVATVEIVTFH